MRWGKSDIIVAMTTFYNENLGISIPGLRHIRKKFTLIIFNDNPDTKLTPRHIRRLGYRGKSIIMNCNANLGTMGARLAIMNAICKMSRRPQWTLFVDDDDILLNCDVPPVNKNNFAVIQNSVEIRHRVIDLMRVMKCPQDFCVDDENVVLNTPHIGLAGTLVRTDVIVGAAEIINTIANDADIITATLGFRPPFDAIMWSWINMYARHLGDDATPIYMNTVNYVSVKIDTAAKKYGVHITPLRNAATQYQRAISKYNGLMAAALRG